MSKSRRPGLRRNPRAPKRAWLLAGGGIQKKHKVASRNVFRHLGRKLLRGNYLHVGSVAKKLFQLISRATSDGVVAAQHVSVANNQGPRQFNLSNVAAGF